MPSQPVHDSLIEDVRNRRRELFEKLGGTLEALYKHIREEQDKEPARVVRRRRGEKPKP